MHFMSRYSKSLSNWSVVNRLPNYMANTNEVKADGLSICLNLDPVW